MFVRVLLVVFTLVVCGCGGGGGSSASDPVDNPRETTPPAPLAFTAPGPLSVTVGETVQNTVADENSSGAIQYTSSDDAVAVVDQTGTVKGLAYGAAVITATREPGGAQDIARYTVQVERLSQQLTFGEVVAVQMGIGTAESHEVSGNVGTGAISYTSSNPSVVSVDDSGNVQAHELGSAIITATIQADEIYEGATASYDVSVERLHQKITFGAPASVSIKVGTSVSRQVTGGLGSGEISYSTSNPAVASVDGSGSVQGIAPGTTTITATKAQDSIYQGASAHYVIEVNAAAAPIEIVAWVGPNETELEIGNAQGMEFFRTPDLACDFRAYNTCQDVQHDVLSDAVLTDTTFTLDRPALYAFGQGDNQQTTEVSASLYTGRGSAGYVVFKDRLWVIGGNLDTKPEGERGTDRIRSSADGLNWIEHRPFDLTGARPLQVGAIYEFKGKLWVIDSIFTSILSSDDGINWTQERAYNNHLDTSVPSFREDFKVVPFKDKLYLYGGDRHQAYGYVNDIWSSDDGVNWVRERSSAAFSTRFGHKIMEFNGELWLFGGANKNDIWVSSNAVDWTLVSANAGFSPQLHHSVEYVNGRLWMFGGVKLPEYADASGPFELLNEMRSSADGINWRRENLPALLDRKYQLESLVFNNKIWILSGGLIGPMSSEDGINWVATRDLTGHYPTGLSGFLIVFRDRLWDFDTHKVSSSANGYDWQFESSGPVGASVRLTPVVFRDKLWLVGGYSSHQVWSSDDGKVWTRQDSNSGMSAYSGVQLVVFNDKLWLIGGWSYGGGKNNPAIWSTVDGVTWHKEVEIAPFGALTHHAVKVFQGKMWLIGGVVEFGRRAHDLWSSVDGINWQVEKSKLELGDSFGAFGELEIEDGFLWLMGARSSTFGVTKRVYETWRSPNGVDWEQVPGLEQVESYFKPVRGFVKFKGYYWNSSRLDGRLYRSKDGLSWQRFYRHTIGVP